MLTESFDDYLLLLGKRLQDIRLEKGFLQEDVAASLNMTRVAVGYIEQGRRAPRLQTLYALSEMYDIDMRMFFEFPTGNEGKCANCR